MQNKTQKISVLQIISSLELGGAEVLTTDFISNLQPEDNLNVMLIANRGGPLEKKIAQSNCKYLIIKRNKICDIYYAIKLREIIKNNNIDIIHTHQPINSCYALLSSFGLKTNIVQSYHGHYAKLVDKLLVRFVSNFLKANIFVSAAFYNRFIEKIKVKKNIKIIHNGVRPSTTPIHNSTFKRDLGLEKRDLLMGTISNFYYDVRDPLTICKALPEVFKKFPNAHFVFIGGRSEKKPRLYDDCVLFCEKNKIGNRVYFVGKRDDKKEILADLDLFVFSSTDDSFGIAIIEAMMMGVPTIISNIGPFREISNNGQYAELFEVKNKRDLSVKMSNLLSSKRNRKNYSQEAKQWSITNFSSEKYSSKINKLYIDICR